MSAPEVVHGMDLTGQTHIVTGGDGGLGKATVEALAGAGAHVVLASHRSDKGKQMAADISARSRGYVSFVLLDLASLSSAHEAAIALRKLPRITSLICNAGILQSFGATTDGFDSVFQIDYLGHAYLVQDLLPILRRDHATVIQMSSVAGLFPCRGMATSPSAILDFTALAVPVCLDSKPNFLSEARSGEAGADVHHCAPCLASPAGSRLACINDPVLCTRNGQHHVYICRSPSRGSIDSPYRRLVRQVHADCARV